MIAICYQGTGKSSLSRQNPEKYIDMDTLWEEMQIEFYCRLAKMVSDDGLTILVPPNPDYIHRLNELFGNELVAIYPSPGLKDKWLKKLENRSNEDPSFNNIHAYYDAVGYYDEQIEELDSLSIKKIVIESMDYSLKDILESANKS